MGEVFSGILTTLGFGLDPEGKHNDGSFIAAWRIDAFADLEWFKQQVSDFIRIHQDVTAGGGQLRHPLSRRGGRRTWKGDSWLRVSR